MKIIYFYQYFSTPEGSWGTRVYEFTKEWIEEGHEVTVITAPYEKSDLKVSNFLTRLNISGINVIVINLGDSNRVSVRTRVFRALGFALTSIWFALKLNYDICISSSGPITVGLPMIIAKKIKRRRAIFEVRDLWPAGGIEMGLIKTHWKKKLALWFETLCYRSADVVVTASIGQKEHIHKRFGNLEIEVIPNVSNTELFRNRRKGERLPDWTNGKKIFTHIGSMGLIHYAAYWLDVAKELKTIDHGGRIIFVFIGDGKDKEFLVAEKERLGLENVYFLGLRPKKELPLWLKHSVGTLCATLNNAIQDTCSPNKIFDSFAANVPIIQTTNGWIKKLVEKENCGINVSLDDPKDTALKIKRMSEDNIELTAMRRNAFRLANTIFNKDLLAKSYLEILDRVRKN